MGKLSRRVGAKESYVAGRVERENDPFEALGLRARVGAQRMDLAHLRSLAERLVDHLLDDMARGQDESRIERRMTGIGLESRIDENAASDGSVAAKLDRRIEHPLLHAVGLAKRRPLDALDLARVRSDEILDALEPRDLAIDAFAQAALELPRTIFDDALEPRPLCLEPLDRLLERSVRPGELHHRVLDRPLDEAARLARRTRLRVREPDRATVEVITDIEDLRLEEVERNEDRQHLRDLAAQLSWALHRTLLFFSRGSLRCRPEIGIARRGVLGRIRGPRLGPKSAGAGE